MEIDTHLSRRIKFHSQFRIPDVISQKAAQGILSARIFRVRVVHTRTPVDNHLAQVEPLKTCFELMYIHRCEQHTAVGVEHVIGGYPTYSELLRHLSVLPFLQFREPLPPYVLRFAEAVKPGFVGVEAHADKRNRVTLILFHQFFHFRQVAPAVSAP